MFNDLVDLLLSLWGWVITGWVTIGATLLILFFLYVVVVGAYYFIREHLRH